MDAKELKALLELDTHGLLEVRAGSPALTRDERLIASFQAINAFIDTYGNEPSKSGNVAEFELACRLDGIRKNPQKISQLKDIDRHDLLKMPSENSLSEVLVADAFGLLDDDSDIHNLKFVPSPKDKEREENDFIANRKPCENFERYEPRFKQCHLELKTGRRRIEKFNERQRVEGQFFVHNGIILLLDKIHKLHRGPDGKMDGRTRVIFENGTMSNMLLRSLTKRLFENGEHISDDALNLDISGPLFRDATDEDKATGYIYVLSSRSRDPAVRNVKNLFKIGYAETTVEERVRNAAHETTYLMAPVKIVASYKAYNLNPQKFENLLHRFFDACRVSIDVCDQNGTRHSVREWFQIPFDDIETAIDLLISKEILNYTYTKDGGIKKV